MRTPPRAGSLAPLRVGVMLNQYRVPFWVGEVVHRLLDEPAAELLLVVLNGRRRAAIAPDPSLWRRFSRSSFLFHRYQRLERWRLRRALAQYPSLDLAPILAGVPALEVKPEGLRFTQRLGAEDLAGIRRHRLDLLIRFGFRILRGEVLKVAPYGIWSFHHGDSDEYRGSCPGFWEVYEGNPVSGVTLQVLNEELAGGTVIARTEVHSEANSHLLNHLRLQLSGVRLFDDALSRLLRDRPDPEEFLARNRVACRPYTKAIYRHPGNLRMAGFLLRHAIGGAVSRRLRPPGEDQWTVGIARGRWDARRSGALGEVSWAVPPRGRYLADPFGATRGGKTVVFVEDFDYRTSRGLIAAMEIGAGLRFGEPVPVVREEYHLSFPQLFEEGGELFMLPEQREGRSLVLYRAVEFPYRWERARVLMENAPWVDAVLHRREGLWWLFLTRSAYGLGQNNLYALHAEDLSGPWTPHPQNPLREGVRGARMAGAMIERDGVLLRPAQNCAGRYGGSIVLHQVLELTPDRFREVELREILPGEVGFPGSVGVHTLNHFGDFTLLDGCRLIPPPDLDGGDAE